jgi:hypothetical protein
MAVACLEGGGVKVDGGGTLRGRRSRGQQWKRDNDQELEEEDGSGTLRGRGRGGGVLRGRDRGQQVAVAAWWFLGDSRVRESGRSKIC